MLKRQSKILCCIILTFAVVLTQLLPVFNQTKVTAAVGGSFVTGDKNEIGRASCRERV